MRAADGTLLHPRLLERFRRRATISTEFPGSAEGRDRSIAAHFGVILAAVAAGRARPPAPGASDR